MHLESLLENHAGTFLSSMLAIITSGLFLTPTILFFVRSGPLTTRFRTLIFRLILSSLIFIYGVPLVFDKLSNRVILKEDAPLKNSNTLEIHNKIPFISDMHADTLMWKYRESFLTGTNGHVTLPKMQASGMALQTFAIVNSIPHTLNMKFNVNNTDIFPFLVVSQLYDFEAWFSPLGRAKSFSKLLHSFEAESKGMFTVIKDQRTLNHFLKRRKSNRKMASGLLSVEGAQVLEYNLENVDTLFNLGVRMFGLNHFTDNQVGGSAHGSTKYGLSQFGKKVIEKVIEKNIIIDLAHASEEHMNDVLDLTESRGTMVVISHTGVKGKCDNIRNVSDDILKRVAKRGGIVGIAFFSFVTCGRDFKSAAESIKFVADLVGVDHVTLGSDWDGTINAFGDASHLVYLTDELVTLGYNQSEIDKIMGGNYLRVLSQTLPK